MVANILPADPPPDPGVGSISQKSTFLEHGYVANQIKENTYNVMRVSYSQ